MFCMERRSFNIVGDIAIIEAKTKGEEKQLVEKITTTYPRIKSIFKKESESSGKFRRKKMRIVFKDTGKVKASGLKTSETMHIEHGCRFKLDVRKVFFNPREATIRNVLAREVKDGEQVLVMFSGVGPYPIMFAKKAHCKVEGVEVNPTAHAYAIENVRLNKVQEHVTLIQGDVRKVQLGNYDRIVMPLALTAIDYFDLALEHCTKGGTIHVYGRVREGSNEFENQLKEIARNKGVKIRIVKRRKVLPYSPGVWKQFFDVKVV